MLFTGKTEQPVAEWSSGLLYLLTVINKGLPLAQRLEPQILHDSAERDVSVSIAKVRCQLVQLVFLQ